MKRRNNQSAEALRKAFLTVGDGYPRGENQEKRVVISARLDLWYNEK